MPFAEVTVNSPVAQRRTFSYEIPSALDIKQGQAVRVPFGDKVLQGIVMEITASPAVPETREIAGVIDSLPLLSPEKINLARWISSCYLAPLFESVSLMLPPGFDRKVLTFLEISTGTETAQAAVPELAEAEAVILNRIQQTGKTPLKVLEKSYGIKYCRRVINRLVNLHLISRKYILEKQKIKPLVLQSVRLATDIENALVIAGSLKRSPVRAGLLEYLIEKNSPVLIKDLNKSFKNPLSLIKPLVEKGLVELSETRILRDPVTSSEISLPLALPLTPAQNAVFQTVCRSLDATPETEKSRTFLLHGVTGSGKTEIYIRVLEEVIKRGKKGIVLVPEISLTPQTIERFVSRFPGRVATLHSGLTSGQRYDEWWRIKNGEFDVVIGPRSAIFAPQPDLGLIIVDEEHEASYKQEEGSPRYHCREVALKLAEQCGAIVMLGSATPEVESYYRAQTGRYTLLTLAERVTPVGGLNLPGVEVVDLKSELKAGNFSIFSRSLTEAIKCTLDKKEQVLLFLNRRGFASFVECRNCGLVLRCKRCDLPLSYHSSEENLVCHQCNFRMPVPRVCPDCSSPRIKFLGLGTEAVEQEASRQFPGARILRWDSDIVRRKGIKHLEVYENFRSGKSDILVGTQMIARGLEFPGVTLVGVVSADITLNLPDFRAGERSFQLLSQVAGWAGRGKSPGKVIIQTYSPEHYAVRAAASHDFLEFYRKELLYRKELHNPPFTRHARLLCSRSTDERCAQETARIKKALLEERDSKGIPDIEIIGPAPAFIPRLRGRSRWQLVVRAPDPSSFLSSVRLPVGWLVDIDPVGLK